MLYGSIETNIITKQEDLKGALKNKVPEGALYFEGVVSTGDKNRNGYIIDVKAWFFEKSKYVNEFLNSGSVLYGHDADKPIGRPLSFKKSGEEIRVSGYVFDDVYTNGAIGRGLILGLSTGHITHEALYRNNKSGEEMNSKDFSKKVWEDEDLWEEYRNGLWDYVVNKAEIVEFSFVTTPSNRKSVLNGVDEILANDISTNLNIDPKEVENNLFLKNDTMTKVDVKKNSEEEVKTDAPTTGEDVETTTDENKKVDTEENEVETLKNKLASKDSQIESLKNSLSDKDTEINTLKDEVASKDTEINKLRDEAKEKVLANANIKANGIEDSEVETDEVETMEDFTKKYSK